VPPSLTAFSATEAFLLVLASALRQLLVQEDKFLTALPASVLPSLIFHRTDVSPVLTTASYAILIPASFAPPPTTSHQEIVSTVPTIASLAARIPSVLPALKATP
jgi:hypothetical protein